MNEKMHYILMTKARKAREITPAREGIQARKRSEIAAQFEWEYAQHHGGKLPRKGSADCAILNALINEAYAAELEREAARVDEAIEKTLLQAQKESGF